MKVFVARRDINEKERADGDSSHTIYLSATGSMSVRTLCSLSRQRLGECPRSRRKQGISDVNGHPSTSWMVGKAEGSQDDAY